MTVHHTKRRGALVPLSAFIMLFFLVMVAFAVDLSWIALTQSELQNSADASALAGANALVDDYVLYHLPGQSASRKSQIMTTALSNARKAAKDVAKYNGAGDKKTLNLRDEDIEFGHMNVNNVYTPQPTYTGFPNTVKVKVRRDDSANGVLGLYFARVVGKSNIALAAPAAATLYSGVIDSFKVNPKRNIGVLPMTYDVNHWHEFAKTGKDPDGKTDLDDNGNPQLLIYPSIKYKGNFGLLSLDDEHAGASEMRDWVANGMRSTDLTTLISRNLLPLSAHPKDKWDWRGDNGFKASLVMEVNDYVGKSFLLPLFQPKVPTLSGYLAGIGQGSFFDFNIVEFVGVKIMEPDDDNREVIVQPSALIEPDAIFKTGTLTPAQPPTSTSPVVTTFAAPRLSQ